MQRYRIAQQDVEGGIQAVAVRVAFEGGPSVGATIPADERNADYQVFLGWCAEGNEPDPMEGA